MQVSVIITAYNNKDIIDECIQSVKRQTIKPKKIIVVDDASTDGTPKHINEEHPDIVIITKEKNLGPSHSRNLGLREVTTEYVVFMDSDVTIEPDWIEKQLKFMKEHIDVAVLGGVLYYPDGTINSCGGGFRMGFGFDLKKIETRYVAYCPSAVILVKTQVIKNARWRNDFWYGCEDLHFGLFHNSMVNAEAKAVHKTNATVSKMSKRVAYYGFRNRIKVIYDYYPTYKKIFILPIHLFLVMGKIVLSNNKAEKIRGVIDGLFKKDSNYLPRGL